MYCIGSDEEMSESGAGEIEIGTEWEAVGPFQSGMREHPLMASPLSAFDDPSKSAHGDVDFARRPYEEGETWPSVLGDGGRVGWRKFRTGEDGWLQVSYPDIRWDQLRLDHGWATLGFQAILRTSFSVPRVSGHSHTHFTMDAIQGVEYAFIPSGTNGPGEVPTTWYTGDIYAFGESPSGSSLASKTSNFSRSHALPPGEYILLLRAMYEIRMFGDPGLGALPIIKIRLAAEVQTEVAKVLKGGWAVPQLVGGLFMGDYISMAVRASPLLQDDLVLSPQLVQHSLEKEGIEVELLGDLVVSPGQVRPFAMRIKQYRPLSAVASQRPWHLTFASNHGNLSSSVHLEYVPKDGLGPFKITFASPIAPPPGQAPSFVSFATVIPPTSFTNPIPSRGQKPVILATHGAGVSADSPFWVKEVPSRKNGWGVLPMGKNEWGEDWHGGSMADVWAARDILPSIASKLGWEVSSDTLLVGHSNGGQGAWHIAARYPDRIVGILAASGWLKIEDYVPYTEQASNHFADPALMGILKSALTPYNNDLYASNLAHIPVLALHGGDDGNVPPQHSRAHVALIAAWEGEHREIKMVEVEKKGHWWEDMLHSDEVTTWIEGLPRRETWDEDRKRGFTITCANPDESGGRAGIRILELIRPGRLARLDVNARQWRDSAKSPLDLHGSNIRRISLQMGSGAENQVLTKNGDGFVADRKPWKPRVYGPVIRFLATTAPMTLVIGTSLRARSIALRIAHDLYLYHRVSVRIMGHHEALQATAKEELLGNVAIIGMPDENEYLRWTLSEKRIPVSVPTKGVMQVGEGTIWERGAGLITLHPHPVTSLEHAGLALIITGNDDEGLELAARLFPIRTGVTVPDWAVTSPRAKWQGAGGFIGAGFWNGEWGWSEAMTWMDR